MSTTRTKDASQHIMTTHWSPDDKALRVLEDSEIASHVNTVQVSTINVQASLQNQARTVAINEDNVQDYAAAMAAGHVFPMPVLCRVGDEARYRIAGGNHRFAAATRVNGDNVLVAHCCEVEHMLDFLLLAKALNRVEGDRLQRRDATEQGVDLVLRHGMSVRDAASALSISDHTLAKNVRGQQARDVCRDIGAPYKCGTHAHWYAIAKFDDNHALLHAFARAIAAGMSCDTLKAVKRAVAHEPNEQAKIAAIDAAIANEKKTTNGRARGARSRLSLFNECLHRLELLTKEVTTWQQLQLDATELSAIETRWQNLDSTIRAILKTGGE